MTPQTRIRNAAELADVRQLWSAREQRDTPALHSDEGPAYRLGVWLMWSCLIVLLLWSALAPLDKGVMAAGQLVVSGNRKAVQHPTGGLVNKILVSNGDQVQQGQLLVQLNPLEPRSRFQSLRSRYLGLRAEEARLMAELAGDPQLTPKTDEFTDPQLMADALALQQQLMQRREQTLTTELSALEQSAQGLNASLAGFKSSLQSKEAQRQNLQQQLSGLRQLAEQGSVARYQLLEAERFYAQLDGAISEDIGNIGQLQSQVLELGLRKAQRQMEYRRDLNEQLANTRQQLDDVFGRLQTAQFELQNTDIRAPVAGVVVEMQVFTEGGVIAPGSPLMELVPLQGELEVQAQLRPDRVDNVRPGLQVELVFSAFEQSTTPRLFGEVALVAADSMTDQRTGLDYYPLTIRILPESLERIEQHRLEQHQTEQRQTEQRQTEHGLDKPQLQLADNPSFAFRPGMPVQVMIRTGERSLLNYLFQPLYQRMLTAFTEG